MIWFIDRYNVLLKGKYWSTNNHFICIFPNNGTYYELFIINWVDHIFIYNFLLTLKREIIRG